MPFAKIETRRAYHRKYQNTWRVTHKVEARNWCKRWRQRMRIDLIQKMGGKCIKCGFSDWRTLQIDHVNSDGFKEPKGGWLQYRKKVLADKKNKYQLLCSNCNWIKRYENNEHSNLGRV